MIPIHPHCYSGVIGFVSSQQRLNVAMTRARYCLAIVGDFSTFVRNPLFDRLFRPSVCGFERLCVAAKAADTRTDQTNSETICGRGTAARPRVAQHFEIRSQCHVVNNAKVTTKLVSDTLVTRSVKRAPSDDANAAVASEELDKVETSVGFQSSVLEDLPFQLQISDQVRGTILKMTVASQRQNLINILLKLGSGHFDKENLRRTWAEQQNQSISGLALEESQRISGILQVAGSSLVRPFNLLVCSTVFTGSGTSRSRVVGVVDD
jgi:hypothetical protein